MPCTWLLAPAAREERERSCLVQQPARVVPVALTGQILDLVLELARPAPERQPFPTVRQEVKGLIAPQSWQWVSL